MTKPLRLFFILAAMSCSLFADYGGDVYFTYQIGGTIPAPDIESITSANPGYQTTGNNVVTSGQSWLLASLSSTTTPLILTISANPVGLALGNYFGTVELTCYRCSNVLDFNVYLTVKAAPPPMTASPSTVTFNAVQGSAPPASQTVIIGGSLPSGAMITSSSTPPSWLNAGWIGVGSAPMTVTLSINPSFSSLSPGTYTTTLIFDAPFTSQEVKVLITLNLTAPPPVLKTNTSQLTFQYLPGSTLPSTQTVQITSSSTQLLTTASASTPWISVSPLTGTTPFSVTVGVNPSGLVPGTYTGQVTVTAAPMQGTTSTQTINISLTVSADPRPTISGVMNAASYALGVGPGSWISVMGTNLAKGVKQVAAPFPTSLDGVSVQLSGVGGAYSMLVYYISPTQINAFAPLEMAPTLFGNSCNVTVTTASGTASYNSQCQALTPALFRYGTKNYVSATHLDYSVVGVMPGTTPATAGSIITLWGTGFGQTAPPTTTNDLNTQGTCGELADSVTIMINNTPVKVLYAGLVAVGLYQFNIQLPDGVDAGDYELTVQIDGMTTDKVMLPIR
jgi:uncharacterized protein (TIGR03437 family)